MLIQAFQLAAQVIQAGVEPASTAVHASPLPAEQAQLLDLLHQPRAGDRSLQCLPVSLRRGRVRRLDGRPQVDLRQAMGEHEAFHQGVAGQPVGAMNPGAGHLANGVEAGKVCRGLQIRCDTAHPVMRRRRNRDRPFEGVESEFAAAVENRGETRFRLGTGDGGKIKPHLGHALLPHALHQGPTHLIPGGQVTLREMVHWTPPLSIHQHPAFSAHSL